MRLEELFTNRVLQTIDTRIDLQACNFEEQLARERIAVRVKAG
jgi:hypothetical protein